MAGFDRFNKRWSSAGQLETPTDNQANLGLAFLGDTPPSDGLHNQMFQWLDEKDNYLFTQLNNLVQTVLKGPLTATNLTAVSDAVTKAATTSNPGIQRNATGDETQAMLLDNRTVTPASLKPLIDAILAAQAGAVPSGAVVAFARSTAPTGYVTCNGQAISRSANIALFQAIGTSFGEGDGSTTFNVPQLSDRFIRGWAPGGSRGFGTLQESANLRHTHTASETAAGGHTHDVTLASSGSHTHPASTGVNGEHSHTADSLRTTGGPGAGTGTTYQNITIYTGSAGSHSHTVYMDPAGAHTHTATVVAAADHTHTITIAQNGENESRPINVALLYCIKL